MTNISCRPPHTLASILCVVLCSCDGGCEPHGPATTAPAAALGNKRAPTEPIVRLEQLRAAYALRLASRESPLGALAFKDAPTQPFADGELNRRFWVYLGANGLILNDREVLPPGPIAAGDIALAVKSAVTDWQNRSGVAPRAALLVLGQDVDSETARQVVREVQTVQDWRLTALFAAATGTDEAVEVALPGPNAPSPGR